MAGYQSLFQSPFSSMEGGGYNAPALVGAMPQASGDYFGGIAPADVSQSVSAGVSSVMAPSMWDSFKSLFGESGFGNRTLANGDKVQGWGSPVMGAASGLASSYLGMQQLGVEKDKLAETKRQFGLNWEAQKKTVNGTLEDRQRARVASNGTAYQSVGDYMSKNGI